MSVHDSFSLFGHISKSEIVGSTGYCFCCSVAKLCPTCCDPMDGSTPGFPGPSLSPGVCSNSDPLSQSCHPIISSSVDPFPSFPQSFSSIRVFYNESALCIKWSKYWIFSFSVSLSNECLGLISFRMDWFDLFAGHRFLKFWSLEEP